MSVRRACVFLCFSGLFLSVSVARPDVNHEYRHDYSYIEEADGWLKLHHMPATFVEAFLHCKLEGAVLASPLTTEIQKAMGMMQDTSSIQRAIFTGIHATISKSDLTSIEGIPLSNIPVTWAPDGTDNFEAECIIMFRNGTLSFASCDDKYRYICYREKKSNSVITECGTVDTGYKRYIYTDSCYKFHRHAETWRRAQMICLAEGGYLAIINSVREASYLKDLFAENPKDTIKASEYPNSISLGYLDWNKKGAWYTVDGKTLEEAGYSTWESGSPNGGGQYCGGMLRNGNLDDVWCETNPLAFICEKPLNNLVKN